MAQLHITDNEFEQLLNLRDDMDKAVLQARQGGSPYMAGVFQEMLKVATQKVNQVQGAKHRAMLADHNRDIKRLRKEASEVAKQQASSQAGSSGNA